MKIRESNNWGTKETEVPETELRTTQDYYLALAGRIVLGAIVALAIAMGTILIYHGMDLFGRGSRPY